MLRGCETCTYTPTPVLQVVWHLQMRLPAVLPPIKELFVESGRPVQDGKDPALALLQVC